MSLRPCDLAPRLPGSFIWPASLEVPDIGSMPVRALPTSPITLVVRTAAGLEVWTSIKADFAAATRETFPRWSGGELVALAVAGEQGQLDRPRFDALTRRKRRDGCRVMPADIFEREVTREEWARHTPRSGRWRSSSKPWAECSSGAVQRSPR